MNHLRTGMHVQLGFIIPARRNPIYDDDHGINQVVLYRFPNLGHRRICLTKCVSRVVEIPMVIENKNCYWLVRPPCFLVKSEKEHLGYRDPQYCKD
jgi:hypothetical protein